MKMPSSLLFAISHDGKVYGLSTSSSKWRELVYLGIEFVNISAAPQTLWAIGGDHQIYVYVYGHDIPIRIKEEAYENERWVPLDGFGKRLLPTDRFSFSSEDGLEDRTLSKIFLPSMAWQWESDWQLELTLDGQSLGSDGWTYAIDFPATYHPQKQWSSCVRRRKWIRYRRYCALNSWCAIAALHKDATQEPFIDVSVGGHCLPGSDRGSLLVWAVTAHGRVMFRTGTSVTSPEGSRWAVVPVPAENEVRQISVGPTGLVWAVLWNGHALVRTGVNRQNLMGTDWSKVFAPEDGGKLSQVSVGTNSIWAVTHTHQVWFRRGIRAGSTDENVDFAIGSGWLEMVGQMTFISVASNDQVWAMGAEDRQMYFRTGVSAKELTGKTWRLMTASTQLSRASSSNSVCSGTSVQFPSTNLSVDSQIIDNSERSKNHEQTEDCDDRSVQNLCSLPSSSTETDKNCIKQEAAQCDTAALLTSEEETNKIHSPSEKTNPTVWSSVQSVGGVLGVEAKPETGSYTIFNEDTLNGLETADIDSLWGVPNTCMIWTSVTAGAVMVDPLILPNWFAENRSGSHSELSKPWRVQILEGLKKRTVCETSGFDGYEKPIDRSTWIKNGRAKLILKENTRFPEECVLELESLGKESGTLSILGRDGTAPKLQLSISEIMCVACCSEPGTPTIAVHTSQLRPSKGPLKLSFTSETDMEDWMGYLNLVCCQVNGVMDTPSSGSIWATSTRGDVFVFDPKAVETQQLRGKVYAKELLVAGRPTPYDTHLVNSFPPGSQIKLLASAKPNAERFEINLVCNGSNSILSSKQKDCQNIALHLNPRFPDNQIIFNSKRNNSWEEEKRYAGIPTRRGEAFFVCISCEENQISVFMNDEEMFFEHRFPPNSITHLVVKGSVDLHRLTYESKKVIVCPSDMFWRQMGGHLRRVETCAAGVTWGIGYDCRPWVYTGGWGGTFLQGVQTSNSGINPMTDTHAYYVYENQRWNPLTGFGTHMLPTDRFIWSDASGKHKRTKESCRLMSMRWQWVSDWTVDYQISGGVDEDGWQYAIDFPATYHNRKDLTDFVRRRRWVRYGKILTSGPWQELTSTKLLQVSLQFDESTPDDGPVMVWAVTSEGEAVFRKGVTKSCPSGNSWQHAPCNHPLVCISCGANRQVWAVARNGSVMWRFGITSENPVGEIWEMVDPPPGATLKQVSVGNWGIWVLDTNGQLSVRQEVTSVFPEGTRWETIPPPNLCDVITVSEIEVSSVASPVINNPAPVAGWRFVSAGQGEEVWAISTSGVVCRRLNVTEKNPAGSSWSHGVVGGWQSITARGWNHVGTSET